MDLHRSVECCKGLEDTFAELPGKLQAEDSTDWASWIRWFSISSTLNFCIKPEISPLYGGFKKHCKESCCLFSCHCAFHVPRHMEWGSATEFSLAFFFLQLSGPQVAKKFCTGRIYWNPQSRPASLFPYNPMPTLRLGFFFVCVFYIPSWLQQVKPPGLVLEPLIPHLLKMATGFKITRRNLKSNWPGLGVGGEHCLWLSYISASLCGLYP